ncbi:MAG: trypsin-like serine protease, partial [Planctomycetota bacterium]
LAPIPKITINDAIGPEGSRDFASAFDAVVAVGNSFFGPFCSGSLIAPDVVLSARHCDVSIGDEVYVGDDSSNPDFTATVTGVELPDGFGTLLDGGDVVILQLGSDVPDDLATPLRLTTETDELVGDIFTLVGYGVHGTASIPGGFESDGLRWAGQNIIDAFGTASNTFSTGQNLFSADFDDGSAFANTIFGSSPEPLEFEAAPAIGDSGGPILVRGGGGEYLIAGVLSGGTTALGELGDVSWWTGIADYQDLIRDVGGEFFEDLPTVDDHVDNIGAAATDFSFVPLANRFIARQSGAIGFGETVVETDVFGFAVGNAGRVIVDVRQVRGGIDPIARLFDSDGNLIAENDNASVDSIPNPVDSQIVIQELPVGEYFVSVSGAAETTGSYRVAVRQSGTPRGFDDYGSTFSSASDVVLQAFPSTSFFNGEIEIGTDNDFLSFVANTTGVLTVRSLGLNGDLNTVLRGYDSRRRLLDANNNFNDTLDSRIRFNVVDNEQYFLRLSSVGDTRGDFRLSLRLTDAVGGGAPTPLSRKSLQLTLEEDQTFENSKSLASIDKMEYGLVNAHRHQAGIELPLTNS